MTEGVVRNGLWYPDDRDWVEVIDGEIPDAIKSCGPGEWAYLVSYERKHRGYKEVPVEIAAVECSGSLWSGVLAALDLRPKPQPRKDHGPSADTQARDWCHQQWTETERELKKANAYIRELEAEVARLKGKDTPWYPYAGNWVEHNGRGIPVGKAVEVIPLTQGERDRRELESWRVFAGDVDWSWEVNGPASIDVVAYIVV